MTHANDSQRARRTRWQFTAAALILFASVGWVRQVSAADPSSGGSVVSETVGGGPVTALAIDPDTPTTLYAGTDCSGVLQSLDGGDSWSVVDAGLTNTDVHALAIDPATPATLYAGTEGGVLQSLDRGSTWSTLYSFPLLPYPPNVTALAIDPTTPITLYAGTERGGVFQSLNGSNSWSEVNTGLTTTIVYALAINLAPPATLYAGTIHGVFRSTNGAAGWQATGLDGVRCGDGFLCGGYEECDDGGESAMCDADCTLPQCGDGTLNLTAGEQCDGANRNPFDGCTNECTCAAMALSPHRRNAKATTRPAAMAAMPSAGGRTSWGQARRRAARRRNSRRSSPNAR